MIEITEALGTMVYPSRRHRKPIVSPPPYDRMPHKTHGGTVITDENHRLRFEGASHHLLPVSTFSPTYSSLTYFDHARTLSTDTV
jgi:hypothetical protein